MKQSIANLGKLLSSSLLILVLSKANTQAQSASAEKPSPAAVVKYLGVQDELLVFTVSYQNPSGEKFTLLIKDQEGGQLYEGVYREKILYKQFRLPKTERNKISFVLRNNKDADVTKSFEVNVNTRYVDDVAVKKIAE